MRAVLIALCGLWCSAADINPALVHERWPASWITHPERNGMDFAVVHFRRTFDLADRPSAFPIHVSADNRYRLYVNGELVSNGPPPDDLRHWRFRTVDIAQQLKPGKNVIAALVWQGGYTRPMAQHSHRLAFLVQADRPEQRFVDTGKDWKIYANPAYSAIEFEQVDKRLGWQYYVAGAGEHWVAATHPFGWEQPGFDDSTWMAAKVLPRAGMIGVETHLPYSLAPAATPPLHVTPRRPVPTIQGYMVGPNRTQTLIIDMGALTFGEVELVYTAGKGARVCVQYSEALVDDKRRKGNRNDLAGKGPTGPWDEIEAGGGTGSFRTLNPRALRFAHLTIQTAVEPLVIRDFVVYESGYPSRLAARFESDDEELNRIFAAGWRTLQLSAQETFISDLAWERMQYVGDTMIQSLAWTAATGDKTLSGLATEQFDYSRTPEGLTQSRYPSNLEQLTPIYSLVWVQMVCDWWWNQPYPELARRSLPGIEAVLGWYERNRNADGWLGPLPGLDFVDSGYGERWEALRKENQSQTLTVHNLFYAWTLRRAAEMYDGLGEHAKASQFHEESERLNEAMRKLAWDSERRYFADSPSKKLFSQHAQILAVLSGAVEGDGGRDLLRGTLEDSSLLSVQLYYKFFLTRALNHAGLGNLYVGTLGPWRNMVRNGMTTFGEIDGEPRSECHPWSASPVYDLLRTVAGIASAEPGFRSVRITPALGPLKSVKASYPHPNGVIEVEYTRSAAGLSGTIRLPEHLTGTFEWNSRTQPLHSGANIIAAVP